MRPGPTAPPNPRAAFATRAACRLFAALTLTVPTATPAQPAAAPPPSAPSPAHEALRLFEGRWTTSDAGPGDAFVETCDWLPGGRRHMVCRSQWRVDGAPREGLSIFSVDASTGDVLYHGFRAGGAVVRQRGQPRDGGFVFQSESGGGPARDRSRVTISPATDGGFHFLAERATGDGPWVVATRLRYLRLAR